MYVCVALQEEEEEEGGDNHSLIGANEDSDNDSHE